MKRNHKQFRFSAPRQAFTLVELLVVCAIILLLATLTLVAVNSVSHSAKVTKTQATIRKLDTAMLQIFTSFESKFNKIKKDVERDYPGLPEETPQDTKIRQQKIAAHFIRDLMRMEVPQSWAEVYDSTNTNAPLGPLTAKIGNRFYSDLARASGSLDTDPYPTQWTATRYSEYPLLNYYWMEYDRVTQTPGKIPSRAALLFLIIQNLNPEALEAFHGSEVADTDGDGLLEFVDAWGNPIYFLRWAPAFPDSDLQQNVLKDTDYAPRASSTEKNYWWRARGDLLLSAMKAASEDHPDPMDERIPKLLGDNELLVGWFLYPLIYSAGADGVYGIAVDITNNAGSPVSPTVGDEGILDPFKEPLGMPEGSRHLDNIHNHQWYR